MAERANRAPAFVVSVLLHVLIIGASLVAWPWKKEIKPLAVTPVTILTSDQLAALTAAEQADVPTLAQTQEPDPVADPAPLAPEPAPEPAPAPAPRPAPRPVPTPTLRPTPPTPTPPKPTPPRPAPMPTPTPKPAPVTPTPTPPRPATPARPAPRMTLDDLAESLARTAPPRTGGAPRSGGAQGLSQLERDLQARRATGIATATRPNPLGIVTAKLIRLWNPNCGVAGASAVQVRVRLFLDRDGGLARPAQLADYPSVDAISDPVMKAAASRAISAVGRGAPFEGLPADDYDSWKQFIVRFDGKEACNT